MSANSFIGRDMAVDLGTANTLVYRQGDGIVFDQPTIVALHEHTGDVVAIGEDAWRMIGGDSGNVVGIGHASSALIEPLQQDQEFLTRARLSRSLLGNPSVEDARYRGEPGREIVCGS